MTSTAQPARIHTMRVDSRLENVGQVAGAARRITADAGFDAAASRAVELCVVEAVNNAIEHAYAGQPGHVVEIALAVSAAAVHIEVRDRGRTMDWAAVRARADAYVPDLSERGRGIIVLQSLMRDVSYRRVGDRNTLSMVLPTRPAVAPVR